MAIRSNRIKGTSTAIFECDECLCEFIGNYYRQITTNGV